MKFKDLATRRASIRSYKDQPVPEELLYEILEAGRIAPTACNNQPFQFVLVTEAQTLSALAKSYPAPWFSEAPVVVAICTEADKAWHRTRHDNRSYADVDAAIATDHMTLAAAELGLGTCWIGAFDPQIARAVLQIPDEVEPLILLTLGYPAEEGRPKTRKPLSELVRHETWTGKQR